LILTLIPLAILVRIFVRTSRWSILKVLAIALSGAILSSVWFFYASIITNVNLGGEWGKYIGLWLAQKMGDASAFYLLSGALILWIMLSSLDFIISGARYFINKPYVREIVVEVEKEVSPVPEEKEKQSRKKSRKKAPTPDPDPEPKKAISSEDDLKSFKTPSEDLLKARTAEVHKISQDEIRRNIETIRETLADHHIQVVDIQAVTGPTVTLYRIYPEKGVKVSAVRNLHEDIAVALNAGKNVRVLTLDDCVGMEVPNKTKSIVPVRSLIESAEFRQSDYELPIAIGRTVEGKTKVFDLADAPHLLVAGATKQGKSVGLNVIVASLLYGKRPSELKMVFIDPKGTEFNSYKNLYKHYLAVMPTASNEEEEKDSSVPVYPKEADTVLRALCQEMKERYELLRLAGATPDIQTYNRKFREKKLRPDKGHKFLPYIVAIIDEYAQLTLVNSGKPEARNASRSITSSIISLAQMGRAAGIHVIIATQTPRKDVISGMIKANFPTMIAFKVSNSTDSQVILDNTGAEKLIGKGDMLISQNAGMERVQCGYIGPDEIKSITDNIAAQTGVGKSYSIPYYLPEVEDENEEKGGGMVDMKKLDSMFEDAARTVITTGRASTSYLQTTLGMGFARAARVMSQLEAAGIVGPQDGKAKNREVLVQTFEELDRIINVYTKS
jgi:S-DNA-T family DNA segregation ATPase FtsK/SpoIIIE